MAQLYKRFQSKDYILLTTTMADICMYLMFLITLGYFLGSFCVRLENVFTITDSVFENFACDIKIIMDNFDICISTCKALDSCYGVNYNSSGCNLVSKTKVILILRAIH